MDSKPQRAPFRAVAKRKRTLGGSTWYTLECGHLQLRRGAKANEHYAKMRCTDCSRKEPVGADSASRDDTRPR